MYSQNWPKQETDWERGSMTFSQSSYESLTTLYITPAFKRTRWMFLNSDKLEKKADYYWTEKVHSDSENCKMFSQKEVSMHNYILQKSCNYI